MDAPCIIDMNYVYGYIHHEGIDKNKIIIDNKLQI
jgi:hypothetical protein